VSKKHEVCVSTKRGLYREIDWTDLKRPGLCRPMRTDCSEYCGREVPHQIYSVSRQQKYSMYSTVWHLPWTLLRTYSPGLFRAARQFPTPHRNIPPPITAKIWKLALTHTPDPNRSTFINFVHINGRSLIDRRMVVVEGRNVQHVKNYTM